MMIWSIECYEYGSFVPDIWLVWTGKFDAIASREIQAVEYAEIGWGSHAIPTSDIVLDLYSGVDFMGWQA